MDSGTPRPASCRPSADGAPCVTCGDEAVEVVVLDLLAGEMARAAYAAETIEVDISLIDAVAPGDRLLVHGGVALARL